MLGWRILTTVLLLLLIGLPLAAAAPAALAPGAWPDREELGRLAELARNTGLLLGLALLMALPVGTVLALAIERTDLPGVGALRLGLFAPLFIPLPLFLSGWEAALGPSGAWPLMVWLAGRSEWAPWAQGLVPAATLHAIAGLPWVVLIVGAGARSVERGLEEEARLLLPPGQLFLRLILPRMGPSLLAAALVVGVQVAGEITITDLMQVRTFAEVVYTQLAAPDRVIGREDPLARALAGSLGQMALAAGVVCYLAARAERGGPAGMPQARPPLRYTLGWSRWLIAGMIGLLTVALLAVPAGGLLWRAGATGAPLTWSAGALIEQLVRSARADGGVILRQVGLCLLAGALCTVSALVLSWLARGSRWLGLTALVLLAVAWVMPGPVLGLGLKALFRSLLDRLDWPAPLATALYYGPSPLPLLWVYLFRYLPIAMAVLWPVVRLVPRELIESARLEGAPLGRQLVWVAGPYVGGALVRAGLAVTVLSLGELSAGKLVSTPGWESYAEGIWAQMHYGVSGDLAARCLLLLALALTGACLLAALPRRQR